MKFSERIQKNCRASSCRHVIGIAVEAYILMIAGVMAVAAVQLLLSDEPLGMKIFGFVFFGGMAAGIALGMLALIRRSIRVIRSNTPDSWLASLRPWGDPKNLLRMVDDLPDRGLRGVDLRFDGQYLAFARKRELCIRRLDQVQYFFDYGLQRNMSQRRVVLLFAGGTQLSFTVGNTRQADAVLRELCSATAFGKWILAGALNPNYQPFDYEKSGWNGSQLDCDGQTLHIRSRDEHWALPLSELDSCYLCYETTSDDPDEYLILHCTDGSDIWMLVEDVSVGFRLYMQLLNCAPHLKYRFPEHLLPKK